MNHDPTYISQEELGARMGVSGARISQIYEELENKKFSCPFCKEFSQKAYIKREPGKRTRDNPNGSDNVWTDGVKKIINHLAGHYNDYINEYGLKEGKEKFKQDRDALIAGKVPKYLKQAGRHAWLQTKRAKVWLQSQGVEPELTTNGDF